MISRFLSRKARVLAIALALGALPAGASTLNPSGDLDTTFAGSGKASFNFATVQVPADSRALIAQSSGKLVIGGGSNNGLYKDYVLVRLNTNGTTDGSFGNGGIAQVDMGFDDHINAMAQNGAGTRFCGGGISSVVFGVACFTANGDLDTTFGGGTGVDKSNPPGATVGRIEGMTFDRNNKLVVVGWADFGGGRDWVIRRYNTDGTGDSGFGTNGWLQLDMGGSDRAFDVAVLNGVNPSADRYVVVGTKTSTSAGVIALLNQSGGFDTSTTLGGASGKFFGTPSGTTQFRGIAVQSDGHLVVTGQGNGFVVARYALTSTTPQISANLGIDGNDVGYRVRIGAADKVHASGTTGSGIDFRIARLSADLSTIEYNTATDFNGQSDFAQDLAVDSSGFVTAVGTAGGTLNTIAAARYNTSGVLDGSFGTGGKYNAFITGGSSDTSNAAAVQSDGKMVATGITLNGNGDYDILTMRVNTDGTMDTSFANATGGWDARGISAGSADSGEAVAIEPAGAPTPGRIVVLGSTSSASGSNFVALRYTSAGVLDSAFGSGGIVQSNWGANSEGKAVAIQSDGKVVVGGDISLNGDFTFARLNASDGSLDGSFGSGGKTTVGIAAGSDVLHAMTLDPSGKIVAAGACVTGGVFKMCMARLNTNGSLDTSFDGDGKVLINNLAFDDHNDDTFTIRSLQILPDLDTPSATDYKIVVGGQVVVQTTVGATVTTKANWLLARFNMDGSLDTTFNGTGVKELDPVAAGYVGAINSVALQHDEKIVAFGESSQPDPANACCFLARQITVGRFNWDGSLDTTYGTAGWTRASIGSDPGEAFGGYVYNSGALMGRAVNTAFIISSDYGFTRYKADPAPITGSGAPDLTTDSGRSATDNITNNVPQTFTGSCSEGETVYLLVNGANTQPRTRQVCSSSNTYSLQTSLSGSPATTYSISTMSQSGIGDSAASGALSATVDTVVAAPTIAGPTAGSSVLPHPLISGNGEALAAVVVTTNGNGSGCSDPDFADGAGAWSCTSALEQGAHTISVVQTDVAGNVSAPATRNFNVKVPTTTAIGVDINPSRFGQSVTFTANVAAASGFTPTASLAGTIVRFQVDGFDLAAPALNAAGVASFTTNALSVGTHTIAAIYDENAAWFGSSATLAPDQNVIKADTSTAVASSVNPTVFGQSVSFTATVAAVAPGGGTPAGSVTFTLDGTPNVVALNGAGSAVFTPSGALSVGTHTLAVDYGGNANYNGSSTTLAGGQVVNKANTLTMLASSQNPSTINASVTFTASVAAIAPGAVTPSGIVTFFDGAATLGAGALSGGVATFSTSALTVGTHTITATYAGDARFNGSAAPMAGNPQVVNKMPTTTALISSQNPSAFGQSVTFTATVTATPPGTGTPTGTVTFLDGGSSIGSGTLDGSGVATFTSAALTTGNHTITASYGSDATFDVSTGAMAGNPQIVQKATTTMAVTSTANPSVFGQSITFTATISVTAPGAGTPSGTVTFLDGGSSIGTGTLSGGVATFSTSTLAVGNHTITTSYPPDANFAGSTGSMTGNPQVIAKAGTTTTLTSSQNPSAPGQSVTFTATLAAAAPGAETPTGTVTFLDGGNSIGTGTLSAGVATFTTSSLIPGNHTITSSYGGDGNFATGTGSMTGNPQVVSRIATTTTIASLTPPGPITLGSSVDVTVNATFATRGSPMLTGSVTVTSTDTSTNATDTCSFGLPGGTHCTLTPTTVGSKSIVAAYSGDGTFAPSTSAAAPFSVTPPNRTITASAGPNGSITPASQFIADGNTASFNVTPNSGYSAVITTTCPEGLGTLSNNVYTTLPVSVDCSVTATFNSAAATLSVSVTDNRAFARYGGLVNYIVTLSNSAGNSVSGLSIGGADTSVSSDFDTSGTHWLCFGPATQCAPSGNGPFADNTVTVPANGSVSWIVTVPVRDAAPDAAASYSVTLNGTTPSITQTDTDVLVIYHDGFDVPYGDGTQIAPPANGATLSANWDGHSSLTFSAPTKASGTIESLLSATASDGSGFRLERLNGREQASLRAVAIDSRGSERVSAWTRVDASAHLLLGIAGAQNDRVLLVHGAKDELELPIASAASWRVQSASDGF